MKQEIAEKVQTYLKDVAIYKDSATTNTLFSGRNLPSFVKDFLLRRYSNGSDVDTGGLSRFLSEMMPKGNIKRMLHEGQEVKLLTRFTVNIDLRNNICRFGIPEQGIGENEGIIPMRLTTKYPELVDGEMWGIIKICLMPNDNGKTNHVEMIDFRPFKPFTDINIEFFQEARRHFTLEEWIDLMLSSMEYEPDAFKGMRQKLEFLTRLLIFVEPRLNVIELAPKSTGKSYVFNNISKYGWLGSGKITRAKMFYDLSKKQPGILMKRDFAVLDEVQTIIMAEPADLQGAFKSYLEQGKVSIADQNLTSECGMMLMGNIALTESRKPRSQRYFDELPDTFRESALIERFHCFIEGWLLPRIDTSMLYKGWTLNIEYFSEIMHLLRVQSNYGRLYDKLIEYDPSDMRDFTAIKRIATAYMKLLFPHWIEEKDVDLEEFDTYCLQPAIARRRIIIEQCQLIDPEYTVRMPNIHIRNVHHE